MCLYISCERDGGDDSFAHDASLCLAPLCYTAYTTLVRYSILLDPIPCSHAQDHDTSINIPNILLPISFSSLHPTNYPMLGDHLGLPLTLHYSKLHYPLSATTPISMRLRYPVTIPIRQARPIYLPRTPRSLQADTSRRFGSRFPLCLVTYPVLPCRKGNDICGDLMNGRVVLWCLVFRRELGTERRVDLISSCFRQYA